LLALIGRQQPAGDHRLPELGHRQRHARYACMGCGNFRAVRTRGRPAQLGRGAGRLGSRVREPRRLAGPASTRPILRIGHGMWQRNAGTA
jgi:hypothetical protein